MTHALASPQITMLNSMAARDFAQALEQFCRWGLQVLDLKGSIFRKNVAALTVEEAKQANKLILGRGLQVYCLSTSLFDDDVEIGQEAFQQKHLASLSRVLEIAQILQPKLIRLMAASSARRQEIGDGVAYASTNYPWLFDYYQEAVNLITQVGFMATIENAPKGCLLSNPEEVSSFFEALGQQRSASFTWDVVNFWQAGTYPTPDVYKTIKPLIGYYHVKGGRYDGQSQELKWRSSLERASWPITEITRQVVADGISPVICLNDPHGAPSPDEDDEGRVERDLNFLKQLLNERAK